MRSHLHFYVGMTFIAMGCQRSPEPRLDRWEHAQESLARRIAIVSNINLAERSVEENLANAETTAYKAVRTEVRDGHVTAWLDMTQGALTQTNRQLDIVIQGEGFLKIKSPPSVSNSGEAYTRNGNLTLDKNGAMIVNIGDGCKVVPPITFPKNATDIGIAPDGVITYLTNENATRQTAGRLQLSNFRNHEGLKRTGSVYLPTDESGNAETGNPGDNATGSVLQGYLESSNVEVKIERMRLDFLNEWRKAVAP